MKASDFEYRHRMLLHLAVASIAFLTYLVDRDDIVWALVRGHHEARLLERVGFTLATLLIGVGAALRTWGRADQLAEGSAQQSVFGKKSNFRHLRYPLHVGTLLFAIGLGSLAPLPGFIFLVIAEAILVIRLIAREKAADTEGRSQPPSPQRDASVIWRHAVRLELGKWGLFVTLVVFTSILNDRVAEVLGAGSFLLWIAVNYKSCHSAMTS